MTRCSRPARSSRRAPPRSLENAPSRPWPASLLTPRRRGDRRSRRQRRNIEHLPTLGEWSAQRPQKANALQWQQLNHARRKNVGHVERGRTFFRGRIPRILRQRLQNHSRRAKQPTQHRARIINRLRIRVASLQSQPGPGRVLGHATLQRVISRVRTAGDQQFLSIASGRLPGRVELREWRVRRVGSAVTVRVINPRQVNPCSSYIRNIDLHVAKVMIDARGPGPDVAVAEVLGDAGYGEQLYLVSGRERSQIILESRQIDLSIRRNILRPASCENWLPLDIVGSRQVLRHERILKRN